ncbi:hypothetical protein BCR35DRAFT_301839 [Leucosporidium creatinivorum]|uniref:F-box domain-containing protein n=1 Tax=Leucosporidium creatinivorum TaxID=106004 RepID=A0A1Y2G0B1_9BASI|nr:hypothetical protein BCR35DRAFT_301839 [Leucosporidium creatinivorum]
MAEHSAQMADQEAARRVRLGLPAIPSKGNAEGESAVASTSRTPSTTTQKASETRVNAQDLASAEKNRIAPVKKRAAALPSSSSRGISSSKLKLPLNIWSIIIADDSLSYFDLKCLQRVCQRFRALVRMPKLDHRLFRQRPRRDLLPHEDDSSWGEDLRGLHPILKYTNFHANKLDDFTADLHHSTGSKKFIVARHSVANEMATSPPSTTLRLAVFDEYQTVVKNSFGVTVLDVIKAAIKQWNAPCDPYQWDGLAEFASGAPMTWSDDEEEDMYGNDEKGDPTHWNVTQKTSGGAMVWREWAELFWDEELGPHLLGPPMHEMHPGDW